MELALHVISFIDGPRTLAQVARVSSTWNSLLRDEANWKRMCVRHLFRTIPQCRSYRELFRRKYCIEIAWTQGPTRVTALSKRHWTWPSDQSTDEPTLHYRRLRQPLHRSF